MTATETAGETSSATALALVGARPHEVIALNQPQLVAAHAQMLAWVETARTQTFTELDEERTNLATATERKWATEPFKKRVARLTKRVEFFDKIEAALREGYVLVPNFPMTVFAIRTDARAPKGGIEEGRWNQFVQRAQILPEGHGRYVDPRPKVMTQESQVPDGNGGKKTAVSQWPAEEFDAVTFPLAMARPLLMTRAGETMARKIFDEVGIVTDSGGPRPDPILVGRILNPNRGRPPVSFFLGWSFDPSRL